MTTQTVPTSPDDRSKRAATQQAMARRMRMPGQARPNLDELLRLDQEWLSTGGIQ